MYTLCCVLECCVHRGVSDSCQPVLCGEGPVSSGVSMIDCFPEVNKVFQCMSGEQIMSI